MSDDVENEGDFELTEEETRILTQKGLLFEQLLESGKFKQFIDMNYDIIFLQDTNTIQVVEVPDEVALERASKIMQEQQKNAPRVQPASASDLKKFSGR